MFDFNKFKYLACDLPESIKCYKYSGEFEKEIETINKFLNGDITKAMRSRLELELIIADGMMSDYSYSFDEALKLIQSKISDFSADELYAAMDSGAADWRLVNGTEHFQDCFLGSLLINTSSLSSRLFDSDERKKETEKQCIRNEAIEMMKFQGSCSFRYHIKHSIKPIAEYEREGEFIKVHLPIPLNTAEQHDIQIINLSPDAYISETPQRTAYFETKYKAGQSFTVEYKVTNTAYYRNPDPEVVAKTIQPDFYTAEQYPHIRFTPYMKNLADEISSGESNPLLLAWRVFDYITSHVKYSYLREYLLLENIPEFTALNGRGDCGAQALLFITLCRYLKIPARWQSGFSIHLDTLDSGTVGSHDWAQYYIAPYGWLFADCTAPQYLHDFYKSNADPFRVAANSEFQYQFAPHKSFVRIDPYDNQSGEIEYSDSGLKCNEVEHKRILLEVEQLKQ